MGFLIGGNNRPNTSLSSLAEEDELPVESSLNEQGITIKQVVETPSSVNGQQIATITDFNLEEVKITSVITGNFEPIIAKGLSEQRPEVLSLNEFIPVYKGNSNDLSNPGKFINLQFDVNRIRTKNILNMIEILKENANTEEIVEELESKIEDEIRKAEEEVNFLRTVVLNARQTKKAFKIKENEEAIRREIARLRNAHIRSVKTLKEIFVEDLGFSSTGYEEFLDTKILMTMLEDLKHLIALHSPLLFESNLQNREADNSSIKITKIEEISGGRFNLLPIDLSSVGFGADNLEDWVELFDDRLPQSTVDKTLFLSNFLSKEFSVSAGLGRSSINALLNERFPNAPRDIRMFNSVLGSAGRTILDPIFGENSLANLLRFEDQNQNIIMSFENKFIENDGITYVPGTNRFIDSVLKSEEAPLTVNPIRSFQQQFDRTVNVMETTIQDSFLLDSLPDRELKDALKPAQIYRKFMETMNEILAPSIEPANLNIHRRVNKIFGLFNEAKEDKEMKKLLFKVFIAEGLTRVHGQSSSPNVSSFYTKIKDAGFTADSLKEIIIQELDVESGPLGDTRISGIIQELLREIMIKLQNKFPSQGPEIPTDDDFINIRDLSLFARDFLNDDQSVFRKMNNFLDYIDSSATRISTLDINQALATEFASSYVRPGSNGNTRANAVSLIHLAWMVFDMFMSFANEYFSMTFLINQNGSSADIRALAAQPLFFSSFNAMRSFLSLSPFIQDDFFLDEEIINENLELFRNMEEKLERETDIVRDILSVFSAINQRLKTATTSLVGFFDDNRDNRNKFVEILSEVDGQQKLSALSAGQVNVSAINLENMKIGRNNPETPFIDDSFVPNTFKNAMFSMLKKPEFRIGQGFNLKLLSIGMPSGFMESLKSRFDKFLVGAKLDSFSRQTTKETDIIKINIYKQDLQFEDIVYKPKSFIFEASRFVLLNSFDFAQNPNISFDEIIQSTTTKNVSFESNSFVANENLNSIINNDKYDFLTSAQKEEMIRNHILSFMFRVYIKMSSGINMSEEEFLITPEILNESIDPVVSSIFNDLLQTHISNIAKRPITFNELKEQNSVLRKTIETIENNEITNRVINSISTDIDDLTKSANVQITEDLKNFLNLFSHRSFLFGASSARRKISSPKLFERIFTIPIDPDDFEIDVQKTISTTLGNQVWNQDEIKDFILQEEDSNGNIIYKMKPKREEQNSPELVRYFAVIEQLPSVLEQDGFTPVKVEALTNKRQEERSARQKELRDRLRASGGVSSTAGAPDTNTGIGALGGSSGASIGVQSSHGSDAPADDEEENLLNSL